MADTLVTILHMYAFYIWANTKLDLTKIVINLIITVPIGWKLICYICYSSFFCNRWYKIIIINNNTE